MERPADFKLPAGGHFEFYARQLQRLLAQQQQEQSDNTDCYEGGGCGNDERNKEMADVAANWQQDELYAALVNDVIKGITSWGTLHGSLVEKIIASTRARIEK